MSNTPPPGDSRVAGGPPPNGGQQLPPGPPLPPPPPRLVRDPSGPIGGVATGIANRLDIDPLIVQIGFVLSALVGGMGILLYIALWVLLPEGPPLASMSGYGGEQQPWAMPYRPRHRLVRDPRGPIGGVATGIANALGIDPIFVQLAFLFGVVLFGTGVALYIILWLVLPKATPTGEIIPASGFAVVSAVIIAILFLGVPFGYFNIGFGIFGFRFFGRTGLTLLAFAAIGGGVYLLARDPRRPGAAVGATPTAPPDWRPNQPNSYAGQYAAAGASGGPATQDGSQSFPPTWNAPNNTADPEAPAAGPTRTATDEMIDPAEPQSSRPADGPSADSASADSASADAATGQAARSRSEDDQPDELSAGQALGAQGFVGQPAGSNPAGSPANTSGGAIGGTPQWSQAAAHWSAQQPSGYSAGYSGGYAAGYTPGYPTGYPPSYGYGATYWATPRTADEVTPRPRPTRPPIVAVTLAVGAIVVGAMVILDYSTAVSIQPSAMWGAFTLVCGLGVLIAGLQGWTAWWLLMIGATAALALPISATDDTVTVPGVEVTPLFRDGSPRFGDADHVIFDESELAEAYQLSGGKLNLDLSNLQLVTDRSVTVSVSFGDAQISLPSDTNIDITTNVGFGELRFEGFRPNPAPGNGDFEIRNGPIDGPVLHIFANVDFGQLTIRR